MTGPVLTLAGVDLDDLLVAHEVGVDPHTGAAVVSVPLPLTDGRSGFTPSLALRYSSSAGNSVVGLGWVLAGLPAVTVDTGEMLPRYDGKDAYALGGAELVPAVIRTAAAGPEDGHEMVRQYRSRYQGNRVRLEQWRNQGSGQLFWLSRDADDVVTVYGRDATSRVVDPADPRRVYAWLPEAQFDRAGNAIRLSYRPENADGAETLDAFERARVLTAPGFAQRHLTSMSYGNTEPLSAFTPEPATNRWLFEVVVDYGDHDADAPAPTPDRPWPMRTDCFATHRPGFEVRTQRLCRRILMFHRFDELGPGATLVRGITLDHDENRAGSRLVGVRIAGHRRDGLGDDARRGLPPLTFGYAEPSVASAFEPVPDLAVENGQSRWTDLLGEGLPGLLTETPSAWYYRRNSGGGRFGAARVVPARPASGTDRVFLADFDRDGNIDAVTAQGRGAGYASFDRDTGRWEAFRPFAAVAHLETAGAAAQWLDLNGDGRDDLIISHPDRFVWYPSRGREGFDAAVEIPKPLSPGLAQAQRIAEDVDLDFRFADMTGDGLLDLVRVRNGRVEYWPHLGHGRFGAGVLMGGSPIFDQDGEFDPRRLLLADLDGTGTTDLLYVTRDRLRRWTNACGNRLVEERAIGGLPVIENLAALQVLDLLGDGTPCLVWSSLLPGRPATQFLRLTNGIHPRLLLSVDNGMGREARLHYGSSAAHYLRDVRAGRGWQTKLPRHCVVVDRHEVVDHIGGARAVSRFEYHDGRYDGRRRTFVGFDLVDRYEGDELCVRTWFHPGVTGWDGPRADAYAGDPHAPRLDPDVFDDLAALSTEEFLDGLRALAGQVVRAETYAVGAAGVRAAHPFTIAQSSYRVRRAQPAAPGRPACFDHGSSERLVATYEQNPADPRVTHTLTLETDAYGNERLEASLAYPRRSGPPGGPTAQSRLTATVSTQLSSNLDGPGCHLLGVSVEHREYELSGLRIPARGVFTVPELAAVVEKLLGSGPPEESAAPPPNAQARLIGWHQSYYWRADGGAALPLGKVEAPALVHHHESACFTTDLVAEVFADRVDATTLTDEAGYVQRDGYWWRPGPVLEYTAFNLLRRMQRADGGRTDVGYDAPYRLVPVEVTDERGNVTTAQIDYHRLEPVRVTDPNGTVGEVRCDALGVAVVSTQYGHALAADGGVHPYGHDPLMGHARLPVPRIADVVADPAHYVQRAACFTAYDLDAWSTTGAPIAAVVVRRTDLVHDGTGVPSPGDAAGVDVAVTYRDGFGRPLQNKRRASRHGWLVSGHVAYDGRQRPVERYEPFFSDTVDYEPDRALARFGVSTTTVYDALGRVVEERLPNGTSRRAEHGAWQARRHDPNDTVYDSRYRLEREPLPDTDPEKQALLKAMAHARTPSIVDFDPAGRVVRVTDLETPTRGQTTERVLDAHGDDVAFTDERGLPTLRYTLDLQGRVLQTVSPDAGEIRVLFDVYDRPIHAWDARGVHHHRTYDSQDRPRTVRVDGPGVPGGRVEEYEYGDDPGGPEAVARNARGRLVRGRDGAGERTVLAYAPDGAILREQRQIRTDYASEVDWSAPGGVGLDPEVHRSERVYDALGRVLGETLPDGTSRRYDHVSEGGIHRIVVSTADGTVVDEEIVRSAGQNARGQQTELSLGNGVTLGREYDGDTFHVRRITAQRDGAAAPLLDLSYVYDPVGNIVHAVDAARQPGRTTPLPQGPTVSGHQEFTYDARYRLVTATGRAHQALLEESRGPFGKGTGHLSLANGAAVERYTRRYAYDAAGNLRQIRHQGATSGWTTDLWVSPSSNRSLPAVDPGGKPVADPESRFDASGNTVWLAHLRALGWDSRGALAKAVIVDRSGTGEEDDAEFYVYDSSGRRTRKVLQRWVSGELEITEKLYLDGCEIKRIRTGSTVSLERFTSHLGDHTGRIALLHRWTVDTRNRETDDLSPRWHYQVGNHVGSVVLDLDRTGGVIGYEEYFPYGGTAFIASDGVRDVERRDYRYRAKERDDATGLYYFGHRYYVPWLGRWLSPDPGGPQETLNLYQYVLGNPVNLVDPDGLSPVGATGTIGVMVTPADALELGRLEQSEFRKLLPAEQQRLRERGYDFFLTREGEFGFVARGKESAATLNRLAGQGQVGVIAGVVRAPRSSQSSKGRTVPVGTRSAVNPPAPSVAAAEDDRTASVEATGAKNAEDRAADATGTGDSSDPGATTIDPADGGQRAVSATGEGTGQTPGTGTTGDGTGAGDQGSGRGDSETDPRGWTGVGASDDAGTGEGWGDDPTATDAGAGQAGTENPVGSPTGLPGGDPHGGETGVAGGRGNRPTGVMYQTRGRSGTSQGGYWQQRRAGGTGSGRGGSSRGPAPSLRLIMDAVALLTLELNSSSEGGHAEGLPGGWGWFGWHGRGVQATYAIITFIDAISTVKTVIKSLAWGAVKQGLTGLTRVLRHPLLAIRSSYAAFRAELMAFVKHWARRGTRRMLKQTLRVMFWYRHKYASVRKWRNKSFLFKERMFGVDTDFYNTEHNFAQEWFKNHWLAPLGNSYLNTWLRMPVTLNSSLQDRVFPKILFYMDAWGALKSSWRGGQLLGDKAAERIWSDLDALEAEYEDGWKADAAAYWFTHSSGDVYSDLYHALFAD